MIGPLLRYDQVAGGHIERGYSYYWAAEGPSDTLHKRYHDCRDGRFLVQHHQPCEYCGRRTRWRMQVLRPPTGFVFVQAPYCSRACLRVANPPVTPP